MVEQVTYIEEAKQPCESRSTGAVEDAVAPGLGHLPPSFCIVLVLMVWFALPASYEKRTQKIKDAFTDVNLRPVAYELRRRSPFSYVVLDRVDEFSISFDPISIGHVRIVSNVQNRGGRTIVDRWGVGVYNIETDGFIAAQNVHDRVTSFEILAKRVSTRDACKLRGVLERKTDVFGIRPAKKVSK